MLRSKCTTIPGIPLIAAAIFSLAGLTAGAQSLPSTVPGTPPAGVPEYPRQSPTYALQSTVVRIEVRALENAQTAKSLGARRVGTGVLLDQSTVLTIGYLLLEAEEVELITADGRRIPATVSGYDPASGLGVASSALPLAGEVLELGDSDSLSEKERVLTLGHGEALPTELMVISRRPFAGSWEYILDDAIFTFPPVNNWSGSALIGQDGRLVGIGSLLVNDAASPRSGVPGNLFVPINLLKPILGDLLANGRPSGPAQPWLGVATEVVQGNLIVARVTQGGPADQAGLAAGDIILGVGSERVDNQSDFYRHIRKHGPAGVTVPLRVLKSGDVKEVSVKTMDRMAMLRKARGV